MSKLYNFARAQSKRLRAQQAITEALREGKIVYTMNEGHWCTVTLEGDKFIFKRCEIPNSGALITYWSL